PGRTRRTLPIERTRLETAVRARVTIEAPGVTVDDRTQQTEIGRIAEGRRGRSGDYARGPGWPLFGRLAGILKAELGFKQAIEAEQGWMNLKRLTRKLPRLFVALLPT